MTANGSSTSSLSERMQMSLLMADDDEKMMANGSSTSCLSERMQMSKLMSEDNEKLTAVNFENGDEVESEEDVESWEAMNLGDAYQQQIRPLLDTIDRLRDLDIMREGIELPNIVVVGDQSSGKSSVLESLAGVKLPKGENICTRVPLVMRLQSCTDDNDEGAKIRIEYNRMVETIQERDIRSKIESATVKIAGDGKGISRIPITLHITKAGAPDLTMVDLPGIVRVAVGDQPRNIYEQIRGIIEEYISPKETIILNVLAANVEFPTCESIRLSQEADPNGERTLAVVTKSDLQPKGLLEKVTVDAVKIGLGYVCVRNALDNESHAEARRKEKEHFDCHPLLRNIDKSMVGIPTLAKKLMEIQAEGIRRTLPEIVKKIDSTLRNRQEELRSLPQALSNPREAYMAFMKVVKEMKDSLTKIVIMGEFKQFPDNPVMHCTARLREMFDDYYRQLLETAAVGDKFLSKEIEMLHEAKGVGLPNFLPRPVFLHLLQNMVEEISPRSVALASNVWDYMEKLISYIIDMNCQCYPKLQYRVKRVTQSLILDKKNDCVQRVNESVEMEKGFDFTVSPVYREAYDQLLLSKAQFMENLGKLVYESNNGGYARYDRSPAYDLDKKTVVLDGFGEMDVAEIMDMAPEAVEEAYYMQISIVAYWKVVVFRMGDGIPLYLQFACRKLVASEFEEQIMEKVDGGNLDGMGKIMEETSLVANKRKMLTSSIQLLEVAKEAVAHISESG